MTIKPHPCVEDKSCCCSSMSDEPDEYCPVHGGCLETWPPKCMICGRFMSVKNRFQLEFLGLPNPSET